MKVYEALVRFKYAGAEESFRKVESIFPKDENYKLELLDVNSSRILVRFRVDKLWLEFEVVPDFLHEYTVTPKPYLGKCRSHDLEQMVDQIHGLMELEVNGKGELIEPEKQSEFKLE